MTKKTPLIPILWKQIRQVLLPTAIVFYAVALLGVTVEGCRVRRQVEELRQEVATLEKEKQGLQEKLEEAKSDAYVERIAREELNLSRPGEKPFKPVPQTGTPSAQRSATPAPMSLPSSDSARPVSHWSEWGKLFFGDRALTDQANR